MIHEGDTHFDVDTLGKEMRALREQWEHQMRPTETYRTFDDVRQRLWELRPPTEHVWVFGYMDWRDVPVEDAQDGG